MQKAKGPKGKADAMGEQRLAWSSHVARSRTVDRVKCRFVSLLL